jgi:hypothetical protein
MMACWNPAETEAPEPDIEPWAWEAALTVILLLSAGGWSLLWLVLHLVWGLGA